MLDVRGSVAAASSILAFAVGIGCSSGSFSTTVTDGGASSGDTGTTPSGGSTCDHVIAPSPPLGLDDAVQAIATDGTDIFLLTTASTGDRLVWLVKGGTTTQVADVQSDDVINLQIPTLLVDANNFYVDANRSGAQAIYAVSRTGSGAATALATLSSNGEQDPHFVGDDTYLYFAGNDSDDSLTRVPRAGGWQRVLRRQLRQREPSVRVQGGDGRRSARADDEDERRQRDGRRRNEPRGRRRMRHPAGRAVGNVGDTSYRFHSMTTC